MENDDLFGSAKAGLQKIKNQEEKKDQFELDLQYLEENVPHERLSAVFEDGEWRAGEGYVPTDFDEFGIDQEDGFILIED